MVARQHVPQHGANDQAPVLSTRVAWTLSPDHKPDARPVTHQLCCASEDEDGTVCGAKGPRSESAKKAHAWVFSHAGEQLAHRSFYDVVEMPYVLSPEVEPEENTPPARLYPSEH